jgi:hypothetical protein
MKRALLFLALLGCSQAAVEDADSSEGAATAEARASLDAFTGTWNIERDDSAIKRFPAAVEITVTDDAVDPTTKETKGTRLRIMTAEDPTVPAVDRAPFVNVDEGKSCSNVDMGGGESLTICHDTKLASGGAMLTHTVTTKGYKGYIFPAGWSSATQVLTVSGKHMHYTYEVDGKRSNDVLLTR